MNHYESKGCINCQYNNSTHLEVADCYIPIDKNLCEEKKCRYRLILEEIMNYQ